VTLNCDLLNGKLAHRLLRPRKQNVHVSCILRLFVFEIGTWLFVHQYSDRVVSTVSTVIRLLCNIALMATMQRVGKKRHLSKSFCEQVQLKVVANSQLFWLRRVQFLGGGDSRLFYQEVDVRLLTTRTVGLLQEKPRRKISAIPLSRLSEGHKQ